MSAYHFRSISFNYLSTSDKPVPIALWLDAVIELNVGITERHTYECMELQRALDDLQNEENA
jgi:hypothetical protein